MTILYFQALNPDYFNVECVILHLGNNITMLHVSHPYIFSLSFIPSLYASFLRSTGFLFYLSPLIFMYCTYNISVKGGKPPIKINNREKCLLSSWKWCNMHAYQVSSPCVLPLGSLKSEEIRAWSDLLLFEQYAVIMESMSYTGVPSSISMVLPLTSLRSEEVILKKSAWTIRNNICCQGNNAIRMRTKFNLPLASFRSKAICRFVVHGNM